MKHGIFRAKPSAELGSYLERSQAVAEVRKSKVVDAPANELWDRIGGWATMHEWHPAIATTEVSADGSHRTLTLGDGGVIQETILDQGDGFYTYRFDESPLPVKDYVSTIRVSEEGSGSMVTWKAQFEPDGVDEPQAVELMGGIYQAGLDAL